MTEYKLPAEPAGPVWDKNRTEFHKVKAVSFTDRTEWTSGPYKDVYSWRDLVYVFGPLTDTPPVKVGDKIGNLEQYVELPEKSVVAVAGSSAIWVKREDGRWESPGKSESRSESLATGWPVRTVLRVGGGK